MPIYEYRCSDCGHELEALQKLSEPRLVNCPACHADTLVKKVSAAGFQLKGSGWYVTDFRNGNKTAAKAKTDDKPANGDAPAAAGDGGKVEGAAKTDGATGSDSAAKTDSAAKSETAAKPAESKAKADPAPAKPAAAPSGSSTT